MNKSNVQAVPVKSEYYFNSKITESGLKLLSRLSQENFTLNQSGKIVWESIDGYKSITDISHELAIAYDMEFEMRLLDDVWLIIKDLWKYGFINWTEKINPFRDENIVYDNDFLIENATIHNIETFLKGAEEFHTLTDAYVGFNTFINAIVDAKTLYAKRYFFFTLKDKEEKCATLVIQPNIYEKSLQIINMSIDNNFLNESINIKKFIKLASEFVVKEINKTLNHGQNFKLIFYTILKQDHVIEGLGFNYLGILRDEVVKGDVMVYLLDD